jgi:transposase
LGVCLVTDRTGRRYWTADRLQARWDHICLDDLLGEDHRARQVWAYIETCDLTALYGKILAVEGGPGRAAIDPAILMTLWLYATLEGVGSARALDRLCESHAAYRWICGGVSVNYHTLSDFRTEAGEVLDDLLTRSMAGLVSAGLVDLSCLAVDGVRVRANAGKSSFRSKKSLDKLHKLAQEKVTALRAELGADPGLPARRSREQQVQAQEDRRRRIEQARKAADAIEAEREREAEAQRRKQPKNQKPARGSTTDSQARMMVMADGGYRPGYNAQFVTEPRHGYVVGLAVTNRASDKGLLMPAMEQVEQRYKSQPRRVLADSGYSAKDDIEQAHAKNIEVFCPLPAGKDKASQAVPKRGEKAGVIAWRARMSQDEGLKIYQQRFACERPHADARNRGLQRFLVRGLEKVKAVSLWFVTAHNFLQMQRLGHKMA